MGMREIVSALCDTQPVRGLVVSMAKAPVGRRFLSRLNPRGGIYESLDRAWNAARQLRTHGHEHPETVERNVALAGVVLPSDYAVLYWLNRIAGDIRLFDYGGNMGNVYYSYRPYIDTTNRCLEWTVYDLPPVINMAKALTVQENGAGPRFTTSLQDAAGANTLLVSGTIHYWEKSTGSFLAQFPKLPEHVFINRSPFCNHKESIVSMQATQTFAFPMIVRKTQELIEGFESNGYGLVDRWKAAEYRHDMPFFPDRSVKFYSGFYFRLNSSRSKQETQPTANGKI